MLNFNIPILLKITFENHHDITEILLKVVLNTITLTFENHLLFLLSGDKFLYEHVNGERRKGQSS